MSDTIAQSLAKIYDDIDEIVGLDVDAREYKLLDVSARIAELAARARDAEQKRAIAADELVRVLSEPPDQRAATRAMRLALFHLAPGRLEGLDAAGGERTEPEEDRRAVGPLEQWMLDTMVYPDGGPPTPDDIINAISQLAGVLDDAVDELGRAVESGADAALRRIIFDILTLKAGQ